MAIYIVLGAHRSGTSALAGVMHGGGIVMGEEKTFRPRASEQNMRGFYENREFRRVNDALLVRSGHYVKGWNPSRVEVRSNAGAMVWMCRLLREYQTAFETWGWKDPRQILTLGPWVEALRQSGLLGDVRIVFVYREPLAMATSMKQRGSVETVSHGVAIWYLYNRTALDRLREEWAGDVLTFGYEDMVRRPSEHLECLTNFTGKEFRLDRLREFLGIDLEHWGDVGGTRWPDAEVEKTLEELEGMKTAGA